MAVISFDCPNCGAKLQPDDSKRRARCQYCGANFDLPRTTAYPPGQVRTPNVARHLISGVAATAVLAGVGAYFAVAPAISPPKVLVPTPPASSNASAVAPVTPPGTPTAFPVKAPDPKRNEADFMWDDVGGMPIVVTLDDAEYVLGRLRVRPDDQLHIGVFAADGGAERYRVGPFGTYGEAYQATHFAVAEGRLLVTDFRGQLKVYDLASGTSVQDIALTDRASRFCRLEGTGDEGAQVYLAQVDRRQFKVDAAAPALKEEKLPKACDAQERRHMRSGDPALSRGDRLRRAPKVEGIEVGAVHIDGSLGVARGVKSPGTAYPMAFGFDLGSREVLWKSPVAVVDQASVRQRDNEQDILVAGRYFATYGEGPEHWHLAAFDAKTGARLWDDKLRSIFAVDWLGGIEATANHVFLVRMSSVEVYDAATGARKATIGAESYDG